MEDVLSLNNPPANLFLTGVFEFLSLDMTSLETVFSCTSFVDFEHSSSHDLLGDFKVSAISSFDDTFCRGHCVNLLVL